MDSAPNRPCNPYNPLELRELAETVARRLLEEPLSALPPPKFAGAGIYAIYYCGGFAAYAPIAAPGPDGNPVHPIYVGRAEPEGKRKGGVQLDGEGGPYRRYALYKRLRQHMQSIEAAENLSVQDFLCRYLPVEPVFIHLAESELIRRFRPLWNVVVEGFGIHAPGGGREDQERSDWDVLHPGRAFASRLPTKGKRPKDVEERIRRHFESFLPWTGRGAGG